VNESSDISLLTVRPTPRHKQIAAGVAVALLVGLGVVAPFANTPLPRIDAFIPTVESIVIVTDFLTAIMLFSQSLISRSRALPALACGYLFTALVVLSHILTFPGAFSPDGLFGAGLQTAGWLYIFWHLGLATAILIYALLKKRDADGGPATPQSSHSIALGAAIAVSAALGLTVLATAEQQILPAIFADRTNFAPLARYVLAFNGLACAAALAALWGQRHRSALDLWLIIVTLALISEVVSNLILVSARFTLGWYTSRLFAIMTSAIVLAVLIQETVILYGRIARSNTMLLRERKNKLLNLEALASAIRHEVGQPLAAVGLNAQTLELLLNRESPELDRVRSAAEDITSGTHRIGEVLDDIQALFGKARREPTPIDLNDLAREVLRSLDRELKTHKVLARVELWADLPPVIGQRGQLQEVMVNLVQNAIDAMETSDDAERELKLKTERCGDGSVRVTIADTGPGIDPGKSDEIFEAFFTTKPKGMGLGLAICRMIIERHDGQLSVSSARPRGAVFQITFPRPEPALTEGGPLQQELAQASQLVPPSFEVAAQDGKEGAAASGEARFTRA
jgi:signal transduction histidine kinase